MHQHAKFQRNQTIRGEGELRRVKYVHFGRRPQSWI